MSNVTVGNLALVGYSFIFKGEKYLIVKRPVGANGKNYKAVNEKNIVYRFPADMIEHYVTDLKDDRDWYNKFINKSDENDIKIASTVRIVGDNKLDGKEGYVVKFNSTTINVLIPNDTIWRVPIRFVRAV